MKTQTLYESKLFKASTSAGSIDPQSQLDFPKELPGQLEIFMNVTLKAGQVFRHRFANGGTHVFIPLRGALAYRRKNQERYVEQEKVLVFDGSDATWIISNPYETETIRFLYFVLTSGIVLSAGHTCLPLSLKRFNHLFSAPVNTQELPFKVSAGVFEARYKGRYKTQHQHASLFAVVVKGTIEVEGQLMEQKDGVLLWNLPYLEMEALTDNAIILLLES